MGYSQAGFTDIVGVDINPQPHYPFEFHQADALEYVAAHGTEFDAIHASPPCQGYSIMNNLPWLKGRDYPLLILPTLEMLEALGKPYVVENVMGARYGAKGLNKRGIEAHGLKAGWLCGGMFGLPFYRHRLFASSFFWLAPGHPKHTLNLRPRSVWWKNGEPAKHYDFGLGIPHPDVKPSSHRGSDLTGPQRQYVRKSGPNAGKVETTPATETSSPRLAAWQDNGAVGVGHAKGWRLAAEAMGIDWMNRAELTQAIPPAYTEFIGKALLSALEASVRYPR